MSEETLVIIGNGFDVGHGLPSKFSDFKDWMRKNNASLYETLNRYMDISGDWWNDFEGNLAEFNVPKIVNEAPRDSSPRDRKYPPSLTYPASDYFRSLRKLISDSFVEWASSLTCESAKPFVELPLADLYVSFNYTDTLERLYGIPEEKILYIHGKALRGDDIIFGHGKNHFELEHDVKEKYGLYESNDFYVPGTYGDAEYQLTIEISFFDKFPYTQLVKYDSILAPAVARATMIWVYGFSFSDVDFQYIEWMVDHNPNLNWKVSWHNEIDKKQILKTFRALGVRDYEVFQV